MRVDPECVYLRLEPGATLICHTSRDIRRAPAVEVHWKDRRWERRTFVGGEGQTLADVLRDAADWIGTYDNLEAALDVLRGKTAARS